MIEMKEFSELSPFEKGMITGNLVVTLQIHQEWINGLRVSGFGTEEPHLNSLEMRISENVYEGIRSMLLHFKTHNSN